jgi:hypothetical protein
MSETPSPPQTTFCFFDETGLLNSRRDKFFGVGMIKIQKPEDLYLKMKTLRDTIAFYDELKWHDIYTRNAPVMNQFLDLFFDYGKARFSCYIFQKSDLDLRKYFGGNLYSAYTSLAAMQIHRNLSDRESPILLMDDLSTPADFLFEKSVKKKVNTSLGRNAALGVCRLYSKGVELIQLTDLLLGAVCYDYKLKNGLITGPGLAKKSVLEHLKSKSGIEDFTVDVRTSDFDVWKFKP